MFSSVNHTQQANNLAHQGQSPELSETILSAFGKGEVIDLNQKIQTFNNAHIPTDDLPLVCWLISKLQVADENLDSASEIETSLWNDLQCRIIRQDYSDLLRVSLLLNFFGTMKNTEKANEICMRLDTTQYIDALIEGNDLDLSFEGIAGLLMAYINIIEKHNFEIRIYNNVIQDISKMIAIIKQNILEISSESEIYSFFPEKVNIKEDIFDINNRLTWVNGDLNCAIAFKKAAKFLADSSLETIADRVCKYTTQRRDIVSTGINNRSLKTGAMGLVLIYKYLYDYTKDTQYNLAYSFWVATLQGFRESDETGFLNNNEGIALAADSIINHDNTLSKILFYN